MFWGLCPTNKKNCYESTINFFLHLSFFDNIKATLFKKNQIDSTILTKCESDIIQILLFGNSIYSNHSNAEILRSTIEFILRSERFCGPLY